MATTDLTLNSVHKQFEKATAGAQTNLDTALQALAGDDSSKTGSPVKLLAAQQAVNEWTVTINTSSSTVKAMKDACSSILQKM